MAWTFLYVGSFYSLSSENLVSPHNIFQQTYCTVRLAFRARFRLLSGCEDCTKQNRNQHRKAASYPPPQRSLVPLLGFSRHAFCYVLGSLYVGTFYSLSSSNPTPSPTTTTNNPNSTPHLTFKGLFGPHLSCECHHKQNRIQVN